jgi:CHAD domain-containing protein
LALVTEELGEMQDAVVAEGIVGELRGPQRAAGVDDALGALAALERDAAEAAKARLLQVWPQVADPALRAWLRRR